MVSHKMMLSEKAKSFCPGHLVVQIHMLDF